MHSCSVFYVFWGIPHWCADSFTYLSCLRISCMELCFSIYLFTWVVKDQQEALLFRYHSYGKEWTQINAILWLWQTYLSLTCLFVPAIMYRNSIPRCLCFPAQVVVFVPIRWSIGLWVTSVNTNPQVKKKKKTSTSCHARYQITELCNSRPWRNLHYFMSVRIKKADGLWQTGAAPELSLSRTFAVLVLQWLPDDTDLVGDL